MVIEFDENTLDVQTVVDLLNRAGSVGVGEWRPEKDGSFGTYVVSRNITSPKEVAKVLAECASPIPMPTIPEWALDADIDPELLKRLASDEEVEEVPAPSTARKRKAS